MKYLVLVGNIFVRRKSCSHWFSSPHFHQNQITWRSWNGFNIKVITFFIALLTFYCLLKIKKRIFCYFFLRKNKIAINTRVHWTTIFISRSYLGNSDSKMGKSHFILFVDFRIFTLSFFIIIIFIFFSLLWKIDSFEDGNV